MAETIHPAIQEMRRFLSLKQDPDVSAFMTKWLSEWLEVAFFRYTVGDDELDLYNGPKEDFEKSIRDRAYREIGIALGEKGIESGQTHEDTPPSTTYHFAVMFLTKKKKFVLVRP